MKKRHLMMLPNGQFTITVPKVYVDALKWKKGMSLYWEENGEELILRRKNERK